MWSPSGAVADLAALVTGGALLEPRSASSINSSGAIVGSGQRAGSPLQFAFLFQNGVLTDLGTLVGFNGKGSSAARIDDLGRIVGSVAGDAAGNQHAFLYDNGVMTDLHDASMGKASFAFDIDRFGRVCGHASPVANQLEAVL